MSSIRHSEKSALVHSEPTLTVGNIIRQLMPHGTRPPQETQLCWQYCPYLPTDVFAVASTLAEKSGCYSLPGLVLSRTAGERSAKLDRASEAQLVGSLWRKNFSWKTKYIPPEVEKEWNILATFFEVPVFSGRKRPTPWQHAAMRLIAYADEASAGLSYANDEQSPLTFSGIWRESRKASGRGNLPKRKLNSVAINVDESVACVMPKALTPSCGCTLRSLSHHLALLPGRGEAKANWLESRALRTERNHQSGEWKSTNLLIIPFPYCVLPEDFRKAHNHPDDKSGYFKIEQEWLNAGVDAVTGFICDVYDTAKHNVNRVDQIILPECSLNREIISQLVAKLNSLDDGPELLVAGAIYPVSPNHSEKCQDRRWMNLAVTVELSHQYFPSYIYQRKHHRWRIDETQISTYGLDNTLDSKKVWWEEIDVDSRKVYFYRNSRNWVQATLICEDLARIDPVLPIIHSIGPNLVVALLMDGPQLKTRWSSRYASVLADDPGSAVLTVTSLGMALLSKQQNSKCFDRTVALWRDSFSKEQELKLEEGAHGLLLRVDQKDQEQITLDRRSDSGLSTHLKLQDTQQIRLSNPPKWLARG